MNGKIKSLAVAAARLKAERNVIMFQYLYYNISNAKIQGKTIKMEVEKNGKNY